MATHDDQPGATPPDRAHSAPRHDPVYDRLHDSADFAALRKAYRGFVIPATGAFLAWYLLYILMSNYAGGFMNTKLVGNINVALVFGLLQFVTTFGLAFAYARYSESRLDPLARRLNDDYDATVAGDDGKRH